MNVKTGALVLIFMLIMPFFPQASSSDETQQIVYKNVAVYPSIVPAIKVLEYAIQYGWTTGNVHYRFNVTEISRIEAEGGGRRPLTIDNYDVFVIGASARQYVHGINNRWKENVRNFVASGGGYVGICGGANEASMGMEHPSTFIDRIINAGVLGIANVYVNDDQNEEWQYLYKSAGIEGGVPVLCELTDHPIVAASPDNPRVIRYEGGPGMYHAGKDDPLLGAVIPIATYAEEISHRAPIHLWEKVEGEWHIKEAIQTDVKGQYAAIATTYGHGNVVLFGPHPEEYTVLGGHVEEFPGRSKYTLFREGYLYRWVNETESNWSYNWWMVRRAVAWAAGIAGEHLPGIKNVEIFMTEPNVWRPSIYINGRRVAPALHTNVIIGSVAFRVESNEETEVDFYLDGQRQYSDTSPPYEWPFSLKTVGKHEVRAEVRCEDGTEAYARMDVYLFNPS